MIFSVHLDSLKCDLYFMVEVLDKAPSLSCLVEDRKQPPKDESANWFSEMEQECVGEKPWLEIRMMWVFFT